MHGLDGRCETPLTHPYTSTPAHKHKNTHTHTKTTVFKSNTYLCCWHLSFHPLPKVPKLLNMFCSNLVWYIYTKVIQSFLVLKPFHSF